MFICSFYCSFFHEFPKETCGGTEIEFPIKHALAHTILKTSCNPVEQIGSNSIQSMAKVIANKLLFDTLWMR